ncbi:MAG: hypothetical protein AABX02_03000, partial [archaeon]
VFDRWYAPLLQRQMGTTLFVRDHFPQATFHIEKRLNQRHQMIRHIRFELRGKMIVHARSCVDLDLTKPAVIRLLKETDLPIGEIVKKFNVHRTRQRSTSRTREVHFNGDLHAKVWERFYNLPSSTK